MPGEMRGSRSPPRKRRSHGWPGRDYPTWNRRAPVHHPESRQVPPEQSVHQAWHHHAWPAAPRLPASV